MNSTVTAKYQTTIPKAVREQMGIRVHDSLEWTVDGGKIVVQPAQSAFLNFRSSVKIGSGDIPADIQSARDKRVEKYR